MSKVSSILDKLDNSKTTKDKFKKKKSKKKEDIPKNNTQKFKKPKDGALSTKVVQKKTFHQYDKLHRKVGKLMWAMHKLSEYKEYSKLKTLDIGIEATNELYLLLTICKKNF